MKSQHTWTDKQLDTLVIVSLIAVTIGGALYLLHWSWTSWLTIIGATGMVVVFMHRSLQVKQGKEYTRIRRLLRMGFLGSLFYGVAGGFMLQLSPYWIVFFAIGSVYVLYSLLARQQ